MLYGKVSSVMLFAYSFSNQSYPVLQMIQANLALEIITKQ